MKAPFTPEATLDADALERLVPLAVRMLDNVIDVSRFPLPQQEKEAKAKRRIGLGVTGLADALIFCGVRYGSPEAVRLTREWLGAVQRLSYLASTDIAAEKGSFPLFDREQLSRRRDDQGAAATRCATAIGRYGIRNALLNSIAPTGTISLLADNVSSGIEPVFAFSYVRHVLQPDGTKREESVDDYAFRALARASRATRRRRPTSSSTPRRLTPADHLAMQAAAQEYVDSSISKTINLPRDISFEAFKDVYEEAYAQGCKGCTTYRPNDVTGAVLEVKPAKTAAGAGQLPLALVPTPADARSRRRGLHGPAARPAGGSAGPDLQDQLAGQRPRASTSPSTTSMQDGRRRPFEVFINSKNMEHYAWTVALTRMISAVFRPRRRRLVRGRGAEGGVRSARRAVDGRPLRALAAGRDRRRDRAPPDRDRLPGADGIAPPDRRDRGAHAPRQPAAREHADGSRRPAVVQPRRWASAPTAAPRRSRHQEGCDVCLNCGYSRCG